MNDVLNNAYLRIQTVKCGADIPDENCATNEEIDDFWQNNEYREFNFVSFNNFIDLKNQTTPI